MNKYLLERISRYIRGFPKLLVLILLIVVSLASYSMYIDISTDTNSRAYQDSELGKLEWVVINDMLHDEIAKGKIQTSLISEKLTEDVISMYPNMDKLIHDMENPNPDKPLYGLLKDSLHNKWLNVENSKNRLLVSMNENILFTGYIPYKDIPYTDTIDIYNLYGTSKDNETLNKLLHSSEEYVIMYIGPDKSAIDTVYDLTDLQYIYEEDGIQGLRNFYFLVPTYITKDSDIVGQSNIDNMGKLQDNHRMLILQQVSIYDALTNRMCVLRGFDNIKSASMFSYNIAKKIEYLTCYLVMSIILILCLVIVKNKFDSN